MVQYSYHFTKGGTDMVAVMTMGASMWAIMPGMPGMPGAPGAPVPGAPAPGPQPGAPGAPMPGRGGFFGPGGGRGVFGFFFSPHPRNPGSGVSSSKDPKKDDEDGILATIAKIFIDIHG